MPCPEFTDGNARHAYTLHAYSPIIPDIPPLPVRRNHKPETASVHRFPCRLASLRQSTNATDDPAQLRVAAFTAARPCTKADDCSTRHSTSSAQLSAVPGTGRTSGAKPAQRLVWALEFRAQQRPFTSRLSATWAALVHDRGGRQQWPSQSEARGDQMHWRAGRDNPAAAEH